LGRIGIAQSARSPNAGTQASYVELLFVKAD